MNTALNNRILLSKKGMKELRKSISQLTQDRQAIIQGLRNLDKTSSHEDRLVRSEHLSQLESVEADLYEKNQVLKHAQLLPTKRARLKVAIGSVVDLIDQQGRMFRYTLVDSFEANPSDGRISVESPLGQTLLGRTKAEIIIWGNGLRQNQLQLVGIS